MVLVVLAGIPTTVIIKFIDISLYCMFFSTVFEIATTHSSTLRQHFYHMCYHLFICSIVSTVFLAVFFFFLLYTIIYCTVSYHITILNQVLSCCSNTHIFPCGDVRTQKEILYILLIYSVTASYSKVQKSIIHYIYHSLSLCMVAGIFIYRKMHYMSCFL